MCEPKLVAAKMAKGSQPSLSPSWLMPVVVTPTKAPVGLKLRPVEASSRPPVNPPEAKAPPRAAMSSFTPRVSRVAVVPVATAVPVATLVMCLVKPAVQPSLKAPVKLKPGLTAAWAAALAAALEAAELAAPEAAPGCSWSIC